MEKLLQVDPGSGTILLVTLVLVMIVKAIAEYGSITTTTYLGQAVVRDLRNDLFEKILYQPLRFFHFNNAQVNQLAIGTRLRCFGEVRYGKNALEMVHPQYQRVAENAPSEVDDRLTPVYRIVLETSGASNFRIVELHWRDFAVFVSLSSRTNTLPGAWRCASSWRLAVPDG